MITLNNSILINQIKYIFKKKNYVFFDGLKSYDLNLIGVRRDNQNSNLFDDILYCIYKDAEKNFQVEAWPITTDPGAYWLKNPMNPKGTMIIVPGQYRKVWKLAKHQGRYIALCQRRPFKVYRDNNKDNILDYDPKTIETGIFGANCHRSNPYNKSYAVEKWSAGCQVHSKVSNFNKMIDLASKSAVIFGNNFTYTLLKESDFYK